MVPFSTSRSALRDTASARVAGVRRAVIDTVTRTGRQDSTEPSTRCPACGSDESVDAGSYRNTGTHAHSSFAALRCRACPGCGTGWSGSPSDAALSAYYARHYSPANMKGVHEDRWPLWETRAATLVMLGRLFGNFDVDELFVDVGPGNGAALGLASWLLPAPRLAAVEFNEASIAYFRRHLPGITITRSLAEIGTAAMVYSSHSLEHVRPEALDDEVRQIASLLRPGGVFVLEVPLGETSMSSHHTPHLLFFGVDGIRALLARHGLDVRLSFVAEGRMKAARERIDSRFRSDIPPAIERVRTLQAGDLIPAVRPYQRGNTIKTVAVKV